MVPPANRRDAILAGALEAARLHETLGSQAAIDTTGGRVDVFGAILRRGGYLLFQKLEGLLGAYLPVPRPGILVTTERSLSIQRYTAAHELGHLAMSHRASLDTEEILHRSASRSNYPTVEIAADAFAAAFLIPLWLLEHHAIRQGWSAIDLEVPATVYQLALRIGASYEATCRMLLQYQVVPRDVSSRLLATQPRTIKQGILGTTGLAAWQPNVWVLTERDAGSSIFGEPEDVFVVRLAEHAGSGYLWNLDEVAAAGLVTIADERRLAASEQVGGPVERIVRARAEDPVVRTVELVENRPWNVDDVLARVSFAFDLRGRERGLPRAAREGMFAA